MGGIFDFAKDGAKVKSDPPQYHHKIENNEKGIIKKMIIKLK